MQKNLFRHPEWFAAAMITVAIFFLHVHFWLNAGGLWRDEVNLVNLAASPSLGAMTHDSFPILMPLLMKFWHIFGDADRQLRLFGMFCGLAIPFGFWTVARTSQRPPLFSLSLFALNSVMICYGDSLRGYGIGSALIVFAVAAMWSFLKNPTWPRAGILAVTATLSVQALYQNAVLFLAICLGAFAVCARTKNPAAAWKILCAGLVAAISLLPYYANLAGLPQGAIALRRGFSPFITELNFEMATGFPFEQFSTLWKILAAITVGFAVFSLIRANDKNKTEGIFLSLFAGATLALVVILFLGFLWFAAVPPRPWYFLPPLALAAACFDFGFPLTRLPRLIRVAVFGFLIGTALIAVPLAYSDLRGHFTNTDRIATQTAAESSPQDFVIVTPWFCGISFERYFKSPTPWQTLPPLVDHSTHRYDLVLREMQMTNALDPIFEKISATLQSGHHVWVAGLMLKISGTNEIVPAILPGPPLENSGWSDVPYSANWSARVMWFLKTHSSRFERADVDTNNLVIFQENLNLFVANGWINSSPNVPVADLETNKP